MCVDLRMYIYIYICMYSQKFTCGICFTLIHPSHLCQGTKASCEGFSKGFKVVTARSGKPA